MPTAALVLSALWLLTAVVLRALLQLRRTGDSGLRLPAGPAFSTEWWAGAGVLVGVVLVVLGPVLAGRGAGDDAGAPAAVAWAGLALAGAGVAVTFVAQLGMGASWRIGVDATERTALVTAGLFRWVRNPIFTAMVATAVGLTFMAPTAVGVAGCALLTVAIEVQVRRVEEPHLRRVHGGPYRAYTAAVGRFLPLVGRST
jgi:protein-S-isoprenylcysteine O-methyltransferase Ste14